MKTIPDKIDLNAARALAQMVGWPKTLDIVMLSLFAGRQRTTEEYRRLLQEGGFELKGETDTGAGISIFEAVPI